MGCNPGLIFDWMKCTSCILKYIMICPAVDFEPARINSQLSLLSLSTREWEPCVRIKHVSSRLKHDMTISYQYFHVTCVETRAFDPTRSNRKVKYVTDSIHHGGFCTRVSGVYSISRDERICPNLFNCLRSRNSLFTMAALQEITSASEFDVILTATRYQQCVKFIFIISRSIFHLVFFIPSFTVKIWVCWVTFRRGLVVAHFMASWAPQCKHMNDVLLELSQIHKDAVFVKVTEHSRVYILIHNPNRLRPKMFPSCPRHMKL